jgi:ADP-ribosylglycohydrolase
MFGAICGDIIGSVFERDNIKTEDFPLFSPESTYTDDTVLTVAVADCIMSGRDYADVFKEYGRKYPYAGYGGMFFKWIFSETAEPYNSFGNGSAMRVSPVGFAFNDLDLVLEEAKRCAGVTHNHPEGIKGAQAVAAAVFLARQGESKETIKNYVSCKFGYNLDRTLAEIRPHYVFDVTCQGSVPEAIIVFLESAGYEEAVRKAVSIGGDSDTIACITGGIAQAYYKKIPHNIIKRARGLLDPDLLRVIDSFTAKYV